MRRILIINSQLRIDAAKRAQTEAYPVLSGRKFAILKEVEMVAERLNYGMRIHSTQNNAWQRTAWLGEFSMYLKNTYHRNSLNLRLRFIRIVYLFVHPLLE